MRQINNIEFAFVSGGESPSRNIFGLTAEDNIIMGGMMLGCVGMFSGAMMGAAAHSGPLVVLGLVTGLLVGGIVVPYAYVSLISGVQATYRYLGII